MTVLTNLFADLHIHIGRTQTNKPVKISAAQNLTFRNILQEASDRKGLQCIGIIDAQSPPVLEEIQEGIGSGIFREHSDGGIIYGQTTCLLGAELELRGDHGLFHVLVYVPKLDQMKELSLWLSGYMKNVQLSTQRLYVHPSVLLEKIKELDGFLIPAHIFTPFKSVYGSASYSLESLFPLSDIAGVELGLSADTNVADQISELQSLTFVSNSDAHSLPKIAREYNEFHVAEASFLEMKRALFRIDQRKVMTNYGLSPKLGKYYQTICDQCQQAIPMDKGKWICPSCRHVQTVLGVADRIAQLADQSVQHPDHRPLYIHQIPLEFLPGVGKKTIDRLLSVFGTEMNILHRAKLNDLQSVVGDRIAHYIDLSRKGMVDLVEGGGGTYGKLKQSVFR
ncbi:endonuclease Q family protein [Croceifilum oryzae]|nr:endonuclease Q family protein [Croceifilum oryzae]